MSTTEKPGAPETPQVDAEEMLTKLQAAIIKMSLDANEPFWGNVLIQMTLVPKPEVKTMGVGIKDAEIILYYNPVFLDKLTATELCAVLKHECCHLIYLHFVRMAGRNHDKWNIACDIAINQMISGLPADTLDHQKFNMPPNLASEAYYDLLPPGDAKVVPQLSGSDGSGDGPGIIVDQDGNVQVTQKNGKVVKGKLIDNPGQFNESATNNDGQSLSRELIRQAVKNAVNRSQGKVPGGFADAITSATADDQIPWEQVLNNIARAVRRANSFHTWRKLNKRWGEMARGIAHNRIPRIVYIKDTSGSITDQDFQDMDAQVLKIMEAYKGTITVIEADADVQRVYTMTKYDKPKADAKGRGGTDFRPAIEYAQKELRNVDLVLYFTDSYGTFPDKQPTEFPVLWCVIGQEGSNNTVTVPWGHQIDIPPASKRRQNNGN